MPVGQAVMATMRVTSAEDSALVGVAAEGAAAEEPAALAPAPAPVAAVLGGRFFSWLLLRLFGVYYVQQKPNDFFLGGCVAKCLEEILAH